MSEIALKVRWLDFKGQETADHIGGSPCVSVSIALPSKNPREGRVVEVDALVDSGCELCLINPQIPMLLGAPSHRSSSSRGNTGTIENQRIFNLSLYLPEVQKFSILEMMETPIHAGDPYQVILGRSFLSAWDIHLLAHPSESKLVLPQGRAHDSQCSSLQCSKPLP